MSKGAAKGLGKADLANIESIRSQADAVLCLLDESGLLEAAALMATAVDAIDTYLRHLPTSDPFKNNRKD